MAFNLAGKITSFLQKNQGKKFTAREIAEWIFQTFPDACKAKQKRSTATLTPLDNDNALIQQIVAEISAHGSRLQKKTPQIKTIEERPRKYYYTESTDSAEVEAAENVAETGRNNSSDAASAKSEHALYPKLAEYLLSEFGIHSKRIDENRSSNRRGRNGNKWLHPDLAGLEDLSHDWHHEIKACVKEYSDKKTRLWSFEVKVLLNSSNIREAFFQTVSNSSWANFGYLVASAIEGVDTLKELRVLSRLHGIGVIKLDADNPTESQVLIPAEEVMEIDWNTADRLAQENGDFRAYIVLVREFYQTGNIRKSDWL